MDKKETPVAKPKALSETVTVLNSNTGMKHEISRKLWKSSLCKIPHLKLVKEK